MSVLIKGMKMPTDCRKCFMMDYGTMTGETYCKVNGKTLAESYRPIEFNGRPEWCPLVELPERHGRLIDADELWKKMSKYTDNMGAKMPFGDDDSMIHRDSACFMIESADTIIEAEGEE